MSLSPSVKITQTVPAALRGLFDEYAERIRAYAKRTVADIIEIGRLLSEAKKRVGYGNFLSWIKREFAWSEDTAERFISLHALQSQIPHVAELSLPFSGLYLLAAPSTPHEVVDTIVARAEDGERVTVTEIKETIAKARPTKPLSRQGFRHKLIAEAEKRGVQAPGTAH